MISTNPLDYADPAAEDDDLWGSLAAAEDTGNTAAALAVLLFVAQAREALARREATAWASDEPIPYSLA